MAKSQTFKYKNQSKEEQAVIGVGSVAPGATVETDQPINNPNFVLVDGGRMVNVESPVEQPKVNNKTFKSKE